MAGICLVLGNCSRFLFSSRANLPTLPRMKSAFGFLLASFLAVSAEQTITIEAGDFDRHDVVVEFKLPPDVKPTGMLASEGQRPTGLQITPDGHAWFIEPDLKRGTKKIYTFSDGMARTP